MDYTIERQLTIALENQLGRLAAIGAVIASEKVNIEALSVLDTIEQGVIRMVTTDPALCKGLLAEQGFYVIEADVLAVGLVDSPGKLAQLCQAFADAEVNISYAYGSVPRAGEQTRIIVKVSNLARACQVLDALKGD